MYRIKLEKRAIKFLRTVSARDFALISNEIEKLKENATPPGSKLLKGYDKVFRVRAGNYRIIYTINNDVLEVAVVDIGHRKDVYQ